MTTMNEQPPAMPPVAAPAFLRSASLKVWRSKAGIWFLRSEELQTGGVLLRSADGDIWRLYTPCDFDQWSGILQGLAADLEAVRNQLIQSLPAANDRPT